MVERFNRRLGEHLARMPQNRTAHHRRFVDHAERDAYLHSFVADYNRTRLRCLDYQTPAELLANLAGHNTKAAVAGTPRIAAEANRLAPANVIRFSAPCFAPAPAIPEHSMPPKKLDSD